MPIWNHRITLTLALFAALALPGCFNRVNVSLSPFGSEDGELEEVLLYGDEGAGESCLGTSASSDPTIVMIPISGVIGRGGFLPGEVTTPDYVQRVLERAEENSNTRAILLRIDSPGGGVSSSDLIYTMLDDYGKRTNTPVYAHIADVGASGGYYVAMAAERVNARPQAIVGSIGVIIRTFGLTGLMEKIGVEYRGIKSGKFKDALSMFTELSPEERALFEKQIDSAYQRFLKVIETGRGDRISTLELRAIADGRVLDAGQAEAAKLIDSTGYIEEYLEYIRNQRGWSAVRVVAYLPGPAIPPEPNLYNAGIARPISIEQKLMTLAQMSGLPMYLWDGGL